MSRSTLPVVLLSLSLASAAGAEGDACGHFKNVSPTGEAWGEFARAVDSDGGFVVVGAPLDNENGNDSGTAWVYELDAAGFPLANVQNLVPDDIEFGHHFGDAVAIDGTTILVGAPWHTFNQGAAYVFRFNGVEWVQTARLMADDGGPFDRFGAAVDLVGDRAFIGSPRASNANGFIAGNLYVFERTFDGKGQEIWTQTAALIAPDGGPDQIFASTVVADGDRLAIGAPTDGFHQTNVGSVYIFELDSESPTGWTVVATIVDPENDPDDRFGQSLDLDGDRIAVGAPGDDEIGTNAGAVFTLDAEGTSWFVSSKITTLESNPTFGNFGTALDLDGDRLLISAVTGDGVTIAAGQVQDLLFAPDFAGGSLWLLSQTYRAGDGHPSQYFGGAICILDSDRVLIGASRDNALGPLAGGLYLFDSQGPLGSDCNGNGICDSYDIADGLSVDCNANGVPDDCDLGDGRSPDCDGNGIPDECDVAYPGTDCNGNGIPDVCDLVDGTSEDCNGNQQPDECEVVDHLHWTPGPQGPITNANPQLFLISAPPRAATDVVLRVTASGDLDLSFEMIAISLGPIQLGNFFGDVEHDCMPGGDTVEIIIDAATFNTLAGNGSSVSVNLLPNGGVGNSCFGTSWAQVELEYEFIPDADHNRNQVPDDCEEIADLDGDGVVGLNDLTQLLSTWGPCPGAPCLGDLNGDNEVGFADLIILLERWTTE